MTAIWRNDGDEWTLAAPQGFDYERELHDLVESSPQVLPLSGRPEIVVLGREVRLGTGIADLIAIEMSGRPVVIEVKLKNNAESRRAVVAQVLTYAAYLHRASVSDFESLLERHLRDASYTSTADAVRANDQTGAFDADDFHATLEQALLTGPFRLIIVLDEAPPELVELVGFLESVADRLTIDLVTVSQYEIGKSRILVPQRVDPERAVSDGPRAAPAASRDDGFLVANGDDFVTAIATASAEQQTQLRAFADWAANIERERLATLATYHGKGDRRLTLLPRLQPDNVGLVTLWNIDGKSFLQFWRSVFERRAPSTLARIEDVIAPATVGQGNTIAEISPDLLDALTDAYREANGR